MKPIFPYIGGKSRIAGTLLRAIEESPGRVGRDVFVDVFGGSGSVTMRAGWSKRIYNDLSGDLVNLFRCIGSPTKNRALRKRLASMPPSREIFSEGYSIFVAGGKSFSSLREKQVERAARTIYHQLFSFGGKTNGGGFSVSPLDRHGIKEVARYANVRRRMESCCDFWMNTIIENLSFVEVFEMYGSRAGALLYCDPPYDGTERYYSGFSRHDHETLAELSSSCLAHVAISYYRTPLIERLYPSPQWTILPIEATKNSQFMGRRKQKSDEVLIVRNFRREPRESRHGQQLLDFTQPERTP
jgi:DNA adenine methylase